MILFLFLSHLGVGIALTLVFVSREAGVKFFRFNAGLAAILIAIALAFRTRERQGLVGLSGLADPAGPSGSKGSVWSHSSSPRPRFVLYWATVGRTLARIRPAILAIAVGGGLLAVVLQASRPDRRRHRADAAPHRRQLPQLGGAARRRLHGDDPRPLVPRHPVAPGQAPPVDRQAPHRLDGVQDRGGRRRRVRGNRVVGGRPGSVGINVGSFRRYIMSVDGIFFWQRVLFGLAGPAVLSYLTWETAKIRSTQSATGILYVDFFTVVVGEVLAKYLVLATRVPL